MITSASEIKFVIVDYIPINTSVQVRKSLNKLMKLYGIGSFIIPVILKDMEFDNVSEVLGKLES